MPVLKGGGNEPAIKKAVHLLRADENLQELEPLLAFFARFALESEVIRQIMRWDMAVLRESPWYNEILAEGREEGREEGQQEFLLYVLQRRFGPLPIYLKEQINQLNGERMQQLLDVTLEAKSLVQIEQFFKRDKRAEDN